MLVRSSTCNNAGSSVLRSKFVILLKYDLVDGLLKICAYESNIRPCELDVHTSPEISDSASSMRDTSRK